MSHSPHLKPVDWTLRDLVICNVLHITALLCTLFRLSYRGYRRELWWEDAWAALAFIGDACCLALAWTLWEYNINAFEGQWNSIMWLAASMWSNVVWWARISILFSFIRITHAKSPQRRVAYVSVVLFMPMWLMSFGRQMYLCKHRSCVTDRTASLMQMITAVCADIPLIVLPIWLLRRSSLPKNRRMLVFAVFFSSMIITVLVIIHSIHDLGSLNGSATVVLGTNAVAAFSLIVCNLFVIMTCIARLLGRGNGLEAGSGPLLTTAFEISLPAATSAPDAPESRFSSDAPELSEVADDIASKRIDHNDPTTDPKEYV